MNTKNIIKLCLLVGVGGWYTYHFYTNPKGLTHQRTLARENAATQKAINAIEAEIATLKEKTIGLQANRFEQEKIIRQDLQMSCTNEYVYLLPAQ